MCVCVSCLTAQPAGVPEILKKSLHSCCVRGGDEVFIIGKNFLKDTKVVFQENVSGELPNPVLTLICHQCCDSSSVPLTLNIFNFQMTSLGRQRLK